jgi:hypothetical protein
MSAKAWWTMAILAAPYFYVLSYPPLHELASRATRSGSRYPGRDLVYDALEAYGGPYWVLANISSLEMPLLNYHMWCRELVRSL